jgi:hypothetical protein
VLERVLLLAVELAELVEVAIAHVARGLEQWTLLIHVQAIGLGGLGGLGSRLSTMVDRDIAFLVSASRRVFR